MVCVFVIPSLGRQRQKHLQSRLANHWRETGVCQVQRAHFHNKVGSNGGRQLTLTSALCPHVDVCALMRMHIYPDVSLCPPHKHRLIL